MYHWPEMAEFEKSVNMFNEELIRENYLGILYQSKIEADHPESYVK